jgi:uncharacterized OsmC-like protein/esterase/lipase
MEYKKVTFKNEAGLNISGRIDLPADREPLAYALFAHCFTCTKNLKAIAHICRGLTDRGMAVLRFDFTGLGESAGDFSETNFSSNIQDLVAAADFMKEEFEPPGILVGHSLGGAAVLHAGSSIESTRAVVTIGAPADISNLKHSLKDSWGKIKKEGKAEIAIGGRSFTVKKQFLDDLEKIQMQKAIRKLKKPLLIFHSPVDKIVDAENAKTIFKAAFHPKSFISLDKADHLLSNEADAIYAGSVIAAWAEKYVDIPEKRKWIQDPQDNRILARIGRAQYRTDILANGHHLVADEPLAVGGGNLGPNPYDFLASGLGACTCMTLRMYADRKKWPVESISVKLKHQKVHADECRNCETQSGKLDKIDLEIDIKGNLDKEQKKKMMEIAEKCPVHRTLHSEIITNAQLKESNNA